MLNIVLIMANLTIPIPNNFQRLDNSPLDPTSTFETYSGMTEYLSNGTRYPGQIVTCNEKEGSIFVLNSGGNDWIEISGGQSIILDTYSNIKQLVDSNQLVPESKYIITDYQTKHVIPNSSPSEINIGDIEPLTLIAATTNSFYIEAKSSLFPTDIIHYRFDDDSCEDGARDVENEKWVGGTTRPGYIKYRKSTTNNLSTYYDWRSYKVRRWKLDCVSWVSNTPYTSKTLIKDDDGNIYICKYDVTSINRPKVDTINWQIWVDLTIQTSHNAYIAFTHDINSMYIGVYDTPNLIINNSIAGIDYDDYYTFCILTEPTNSSGIMKTTNGFGIIGCGIFDFHIGKYNLDEYNYNNGTSYLESNVFYYIPFESDYILWGNNKLNGTNNTCLGEFNNNNFEKMNMCIIGVGFDNNNIDYMGNVAFGRYCNYNKSLSISDGVIGNSFSSNIFKMGCNSCLIGDGFNNNNIMNLYTNNIVGIDFKFNNIFDYFNDNKIGNSFKNNNIYLKILSSTIKNNCTLNKIECDLLTKNLTTSTHIYNDYNCSIFKNSAGIIKLSYYNTSNVLTITDITT